MKQPSSTRGSNTHRLIFGPTPTIADHRGGMVRGWCPAAVGEPGKRARRGYAMVLVLFFSVLFLGLVGIAYRELSTALRLQSLHAVQTERDEGAIQALARALHLLESGLPAANPYICATTVDTSLGQRQYTVTFASQGGANWTVSAAPTLPGDTPQAMPANFAPPVP
jgi:hypothetical protein